VTTFVQGSSTSVRLAGALKCIALLGLGKRSALESNGSESKDQPAVKWGPSVFKAAGMALGDVTAAAKCTKAMFAIGSEFEGAMDAKVCRLEITSLQPQAQVAADFECSSL
jgi:hypothetical protein